jgi:hypothetical protein
MSTSRFHGAKDTIAFGVIGGILAAATVAASVPPEDIPEAQALLVNLGSLSGYGAILMTIVSGLIVRKVNRFFGEIADVPETVSKIKIDVSGISIKVDHINQKLDNSEQLRSEHHLDHEGRISRLEGTLERSHR